MVASLIRIKPLVHIGSLMVGEILVKSPFTIIHRITIGIYAKDFEAPDDPNRCE